MYLVIATSELYHQTVASAQPCVAQDAFQRITEQKQEANIRFLIQQAELRKSELQSNSVQDFVKMLQQIARDQEARNWPISVSRTRRATFASR